MRSVHVRRLMALMVLSGLLGSSYAMAEGAPPAAEKPVASKAKKEHIKVKNEKGKVDHPHMKKEEHKR